MNSVKRKITQLLDKIKVGNRIINDSVFIETEAKSQEEIYKKTRRTDIINFLLSLTSSDEYLEVGVRDPRKNFDRINCNKKYSVDPGKEFKENPVDYKMTSDLFFEKLGKGELNISSEIKFDAIFIDGLHISNQAEKDIINSLKYIKNDGFIILHDCNPPSEYHQRENYEFMNSPAGPFWNGTTWKAFYKYRHKSELYSICFDSDWGVGVLAKKYHPMFNNITSEIENEYYEFSRLAENRNVFMNLKSFDEWKESLKTL